MSGSILPRGILQSILPRVFCQEENSSRFLVQGQKQCGKILKGKFATNLKKENKHKKEFEACDSR